MGFSVVYYKVKIDLKNIYELEDKVCCLYCVVTGFSVVYYIFTCTVQSAIPVLYRRMCFHMVVT